MSAGERKRRPHHARRPRAAGAQDRRPADHRRGSRGQFLEGRLPQRDDRLLAGVHRRARGGVRRAQSSSSRCSTTASAAQSPTRVRALADLFFFSVETTSTRRLRRHASADDLRAHRRGDRKLHRPGAACDDDRPGLRAHLAAAREAHLRPQSRRRRARRRADPDVPHGQRAQQLHQRGDGQDLDDRPERVAGGQTDCRASSRCGSSSRKTRPWR